MDKCIYANAYHRPEMYKTQWLLIAHGSVNRDNVDASSPSSPLLFESQTRDTISGIVGRYTCSRLHSFVHSCRRCTLRFYRIPTHLHMDVGINRRSNVSHCADMGGARSRKRSCGLGNYRSCHHGIENYLRVQEHHGFVC